VKRGAPGRRQRQAAVERVSVAVKVSAISCSEAISGWSTATAIRVVWVRLTAAIATSSERPVASAHTFAHSS
jgi:hypothetical protein